MRELNLRLRVVFTMIILIIIISICCYLKNLLLAGVEGAAKVKGKEYTNEQNVRFMIVDHMAVDFRLKKTRFRIKDVINHGNILGKMETTRKNILTYFQTSTHS